MQNLLLFCASWLLSDVKYFSFTLSEMLVGISVSSVMSSVCQHQSVTSEHSSGPVVMVMLTLDRPSTLTQPLSPAYSTSGSNPYCTISGISAVVLWSGGLADVESGLSRNLTLWRHHSLFVNNIGCLCCRPCGISVPARPLCYALPTIRWIITSQPSIRSFRNKSNIESIQLSDEFPGISV